MSIGERRTRPRPPICAFKAELATPLVRRYHAEREVMHERAAGRGDSIR